MRPLTEAQLEARRDAARLTAIIRATFEPLPVPDKDDLKLSDFRWRCRICGGELWCLDQAERDHLDVHGPVPLFIDEWWWGR